MGHFISDCDVVDPIPANLEWDEVGDFLNRRLRMQNFFHQEEEERLRQAHQAWRRRVLEIMREKTHKLFPLSVREERPSVSPKPTKTVTFVGVGIIPHPFFYINSCNYR